MRTSRKLEQHIAVFGESGSGKTVLLSSFYGAAQERENITKAGFNILAENPSQGTHLSQNYLGMKKSATVPDANKFSAKMYSFLVKVQSNPQGNSSNDQRFDALRLVWHDYPGEWFEHDVSGPEEAKRRVDTFRELLQSDVAFLMVDGQRLLDNAGEEERYLKSLFTNFCNGLLLLRDDLLTDGKPLVTFPRIWILALAKSDVLPEMNVDEFRDLLLEKAGDDMEKLRDVLGGLLDSNGALSVGEDFVLFSSAKFEANKIEVAKRVGLQLVLPLASVFAFERHLRWAQAGHLGKKAALVLLRNAEMVAAGMGIVGGAIARLAGAKNRAVAAFGLLLASASPLFEGAVRGLEARIAEQDAQAVAKRDSLSAVLAGFRTDLKNGEEEQIFIRSLL
jgi:energy-coupling factor transporter ATP-binding protein EcfA2